MEVFVFMASVFLGIDLACGRKQDCSLKNHIKSHAHWSYPHHHDPKGHEIPAENLGNPPLPHVPPFVKNTSAEINMQINRELFAHYTYLSMAMHFDRDDINLPGFHKFFKESAEEEMKHAQLFMKYQNKRGGRIKLHHVMAPCENHWGNGLDAMKHALDLEKDVYQSLLDLHKIAEDNKDPQLQDFIESNYLEEQVESIKELSNYVNTLNRMNKTQSYAVGEYQFDKLTLGGGKE